MCADIDSVEGVNSGAAAGIFFCATRSRRPSVCGGDEEDGVLGGVAKISSSKGVAGEHRALLTTPAWEGKLMMLPYHARFPVSLPLPLPTLSFTSQNVCPRRVLWRGGASSASAAALSRQACLQLQQVRDDVSAPCCKRM